MDDLSKVVSRNFDVFDGIHVCSCWKNGFIKIFLFTHHAANDEEPHHHVHHLHEIFGIGSDFSVYLLSAEEFQGDVEVEDGADTYGTEESDVEGLSGLLDLVDLLMHAKDNWWASE